MQKERTVVNTQKLDLTADCIDKTMLCSPVSEGVLVVLGPGYILNVDIFHPELGLF